MERSLTDRSENRPSGWQAVKLFLQGAVAALARDAEAWGLAPGAALALAAMPVVATLVFVAAIPFPALYLGLVDEDALLEWLQFACILAAGLVFGWLGVRLARTGRRGLGALYALLALGMLFVAGEEISWGQRLLGLQTPAELDAINAQHEISVHNIFGFHQAFIYAAMLGGLYGAASPLVKLVLPAAWRRSKLAYLLVPPLCLAPAFFMPFGYRLVRLLFKPELYYPARAFIIVDFAELTELCLYFAVLAFGWLILRRLRRAPGREDQ